jgi:hypothetical protein
MKVNYLFFLLILINITNLKSQSDNHLLVRNITLKYKNLKFISEKDTLVFVFPFICKVEKSEIENKIVFSGDIENLFMDLDFYNSLNFIYIKKIFYKKKKIIITTNLGRFVVIK